MTAALEGGQWSATRPGHNLFPGKTRCPLYTGSMDPSDGLDGWKISSQKDSIPGRPALSSVAIPTELPGPHTIDIITYKMHFVRSYTL